MWSGTCRQRLRHILSGHLRSQRGGASSQHPTRGLCEAAASTPVDRKEEIRSRATQHKTWPIGVDGEPIRTACARKMGISTSPHKLNLVARLIRGLSVEEAHRQLTGVLKKHRVDVSQCISAAVTNARSFGLDEERLVVSKAFVNKGKYLKRLRPWHGKGRFGIEHKKYTHLSVEVRELSDEQWEAQVLPQYIHMQYRSDKKSGITVPDDLVKPWLVRSQLDLSLEETKRRAAAVKSRLPKKKHPFPGDWIPDPSLM